MARSFALLSALLSGLLAHGSTFVQAQSVVINEFMASNQRALADEDGDFPDWIELYNAGEFEVDLTGYGLTDNRDELGRWVLPSIGLPPDGYLLILASGKDRTGSVGDWHTVVDQGHQLRYFVGSSAPNFNWRSRVYDDSGWNTGSSPIGFELDANGATIATAVPSGTTSLFVRARFEVDDPERVADALLHVDYDDGFVAYLNGSEIARANMPGAAPPAHTALAPENHEAMIYQGGYPEQFQILNVRQRLNAAGNVLAVQVHNVSAESSDLTLIPFLTLAFSEEVPSGPGVSPLLPAIVDKPPHANFKLEASGETIILTDPLGNVVDSVAFGQQLVDQSMGRKPDGSSEWLFFLASTPGQPNLTDGFSGEQLSAPVFSLPAGTYPRGALLELSSADGAQIHFSTNGSPPTTADSRYTASLPLTQTTVIRARAILDGSTPSEVVTRTYLVDDNSSIPIVSLATDPPNLWDYETGIYADGPGWTASDPHFGANYWQDWEIPMHFELFESNGDLAISQLAGAGIYGAWSRARPQKSLALFARSEYGTNRFRHKIWPTRNIDSFVSLVLRNSGNDWSQLHFRDAFMQALVDDLEFETLAYRPAHVYLNGQYWGILNLREKVNEYMVAGKFGVDPDSIDLIELGVAALALEGTTEHYDAMISYIQSSDMTRPETYEYIKTQMDVNSFIDYQAIQIYLRNTDWPGNNNKFWRPRTPDGRYRWIVFDTDFGMGLYSSAPNYDYNHNTLQFATAPNGPGWPNPPASTLLFRELLKNLDFRDAVINRFADLLNHHFDPERVRRIMEEMSAVVEPEMPRHYARWGGGMSNFYATRNQMLEFAERRHGFFWSHLRSFFSLRAQQPLTVDVDHIRQGTVRVNRLVPEAYPWTGIYVPGVALQVEARPRPGYRFVRWSGTAESTSPLLTIDPADRHDLTAHFEVDLNIPAPITISEIQYHPPDDHPSGDWVELYNPMDFDADLSGWTFRDEDVEHLYVFPEGTSISARGFLVVAQDPDAFRTTHPDVVDVVGWWDFGLANGGEALVLKSASGDLVDSLRYDDDAPWPSAPDGDGPTLELTDLSQDNIIPRYWQSSTVRGGSPGAFNTVGVRVDVEDEAPELPRTVSLASVYPNPFREFVSIPFTLPAAAHVTLQVYNILGQLVETLADAQVQAGSHTSTWLAQGAAPGVYFVSLTVDGARAGTRTAVLVR